MWTQAELDDNGQKLRGALQRAVKHDGQWHEYMDTVRAAWGQAKENIPENELDTYFDKWVQPTLALAEEAGKAPRTIRRIKQDIRDPDSADRRREYDRERKRPDSGHTQPPDPPTETAQETPKGRGRPVQSAPRTPSGQKSRAKPKPIRPSLLALLRSLSDEQQQQVEEFATSLRGERNGYDF